MPEARQSAVEAIIATPATPLRGIGGQLLLVKGLDSLCSAMPNLKHFCVLKVESCSGGEAFKRVSFLSTYDTSIGECRVVGSLYSASLSIMPLSPHPSVK